MTEPPPVEPARDENDRAREGKLPRDLKADTKPVGKKEDEVARVLTVPQVLRASADRARAAKKRSFCTTGNWFLDDATGGMQGGDCWLLGADTSYGKSSLAVMIVDENLKRSKRVLVVTSEDDEELYGDRLMCRRAQIDAKRYRNGRLSVDEWQLVDRTVAAGEPVPVYFDCRPLVVEKAIPQLDKLIKEQAIDLVIFDYLQEFRSSHRYQDERVKYKEIASQLRRVCKLNKRCGLILSQLTMTAQTKRPNRHNIRESRDVANAAETILVGFIPEEDIKSRDAEGNETEDIAHHKGDRLILIDKCKRGPRNLTFDMPWDNDTASFKTVTEPEQDRLDRMAAERAYDEYYEGFDDGG